MSDKIIEALAADIREVDGNHELGAAALAEKLAEKGWITSSLQDSVIVDATEYPRIEGDTIVLGPGIFSAADKTVLNWEGQNYVPQSSEQRPLKSYKNGERVEVNHQGEWLTGTVHSPAGDTGIVGVSTERGTKTVAAPRNIRPLA